MRKIGVLGGMGPEATILFQQRLLKAVRAQDDQDHIPLLIDMNPQVPSRLAYVLDQTSVRQIPVQCWGIWPSALTDGAQRRWQCPATQRISLQRLFKEKPPCRFLIW
jgi:hypothetical protein